jgi:hypothetical protein
MKILFAGQKRSGKDTSAAYLRAWYGGEIFSFAEPLYKIMYSYQDILNIPRVKDRPFLKAIGDYGRSTNPTIWIDLCFSAARECLPKTNIYITDGRYENELSAGVKEGFLIVLISATEEVRKGRLDEDDSINDSHSSEHGFSENYPFDAVIENNGTLEELHIKLKELAEKIISGNL